MVDHNILLGWGSTAYSHFEEVVYFLPFSSQKFQGPLDWESSGLTTRPANDMSLNVTKTGFFI